MDFDDEMTNKVWNKGKPVLGTSPSEWRKDVCGAWIRKKQYANRDSKYGWEIDHINPKGSDELSNLQPLQWENNVSKGDGALKCAVTSRGMKNVDK